MAVFALVSEQGPCERSVLRVCVSFISRPGSCGQASGWKTLSGDSHIPYAELEMEDITILHIFVD